MSNKRWQAVRKTIQMQNDISAMQRKAKRKAVLARWSAIRIWLPRIMKDKALKERRWPDTVTRLIG